MGHVIVIGAGQAGQSLVSKLRAVGHVGAITLIGAETHPPYQRPPLSKKYLLGELKLDRMFLRPESYYGEQDISLQLGAGVSEIDTGEKTISVGNTVISYDQLALTTGSIPHQLPAEIGGDLSGVYCVRTLQDADAIEPEFQAGRRVLIVGGGYIGLEAAAVEARKGLQVTLVEMADRILQRVAAPQTSDFIRSVHSAEGVTILEGVGLDHLIGDNRVTGAILTDGTELAVDFVVVGVGIRPDTRLAEMAGIDIDNGIKTDAHGRTSDASIWAAGDCASFPHNGSRIRLESVGNAIDQAELVAENMLGANRAYQAKPWFWSDQFDMKLQIAGLNAGYDRVVSRAGNSARSSSFWYYRGPQLLAVDAINDARAYMVGKRLIEAGMSPDADAVSNPETDLKSLLKS